MGKLVLKTVAITLAAVLSVCMILFGTLAIFAPAKVANFFDKFGFYGPTVHYYEKQYGKSGEIEDLAVLILKIDDESDSAKEKKYVEEMINRADYSDYCVSVDNSNELSKIKTKEYYAGKYATSLVRTNNFSQALTFAEDFIKKNTYSDYNPYGVIVAEIGESLTLEQLSQLKIKVSTYSYKDVAKADLSEIDRLISIKTAE